ncbi:MAG: EipB family protein, partial [Desulfobulbia bacterium]
LDGRGMTTVSDLRSSTWESGEGKRFRFNSSQYLNQKLKEVTSGDAQREKKKSVVDVKIQKPKRKSIKLPEKVLFPTEHSLAVLHAAEKGDKILQAPVYDGSENGQKLYRTTAFIGKPSQSRKHKGLDGLKNGSSELDVLTSWPITISYFDQSDKTRTTPSYQIAFRLYSNGVSSDLKIEYDDFSMEGALKEIEFLKMPECDLKP